MKRVHLVKEETLKEYGKESAVLRSAVRYWLYTLRKARWQVPLDIKSDFGAADFLGNGSCRVVFDLGGNKFRMICKYSFGKKFVHLYIKWIGTHSAYDELCKRTYSILFRHINITVMEIQLPFKVIKDYKQYIEYCNILEQYTDIKEHTEAQEDIIELLTVLIEAYDREQDTEEDQEPIDPVSSLKFVMEQNRMKAADLARELGVSKSLVSDILNYRRGFSKSFIRKLGARFTFRQELWNRPYKLVSPSKASKKSKASTATAKNAGRPAKAVITKAAKTARRTKISKSTKTTVKR